MYLPPLRKSTLNLLVCKEDGEGRRGKGRGSLTLICWYVGEDGGEGRRGN
jgi:hypothetical protein